MKIHKANKFTFDELFEMSKPEMDAITKHFPLSEINEMLNSKIEGNNVTSCIYGILTGDCNSEEAKQFILNNVEEVIILGPSSFSFEDGMKSDARSAYYETPLEQYIYPTSEEEREHDLNEDDEEYDEFEEQEWPKSYLERIEKVKTYIKSKIA